MTIAAASRERERALLVEVGAIADRARELRRTDAVFHHAEIKLLTGDLQAKWREIRELRAEPVTGEVPFGGRRSSRD